MKKISQSEFQKDPAAASERARMETVMVTDDKGNPDVIMISYEVFSQLRKSNRKTMKVSELSAEELHGIANAKMDPKYDYLDEEVAE